MAIYHLLLILGVPWGEAVFGGKYTVLPFEMRLVSLIFLILFSIIATFYLIKSGLVNLSLNDLVILIVLIIYTLFLAYATVFNFVFSESIKEKYIMGPLSAVSFVLSVIYIILSYCKTGDAKC